MSCQLTQISFLLPRGVANLLEGVSEEGDGVSEEGDGVYMQVKTLVASAVGA
jgi:hypothetical protein